MRSKTHSTTSPGYRFGAYLGRTMVVLAILGLAASKGLANDARVTVEFLVPPIQTLHIEPMVLDVPAPSAADLNRGYIEFGRPVQAHIRSNTSWQLALRLGLFSSATSEKAIAPPTTLQWITEQGRICDIGHDWIIVARGPAHADQITVELSFRVPATWTTMTPGDEQWRIDYRLSPAKGVHLAENER